jgi:hypothetical protein
MRQGIAVALRCRHALVVIGVYVLLTVLPLRSRFNTRGALVFVT